MVVTPSRESAMARHRMSPPGPGVDPTVTGYSPGFTPARSGVAGLSLKVRLEPSG